MILLGIGGPLAVNITKGSAALKTPPSRVKVAPDSEDANLGEKEVKKMAYYSECWKKVKKPRFNDCERSEES